MNKESVVGLFPQEQFHRLFSGNSGCRTPMSSLAGIIYYMLVGK